MSLLHNITVLSVILFNIPLVHTTNTLCITNNLAIFHNAPELDTVGYDNCNMASNGELAIIKSILQNGSTVFDVGANKGEWSQHLLASKSNIQLHAFEPIPTIFHLLKKNIARDSVTTHNLAISDEDGENDFFYYDKNSDASEVSSFYHRPIVDSILNTKPITIKVTTKTLDSFCHAQNIQHIDFLKIDTEGSELNVLKGASSLLHNGSIKIMQFEYGGTYLDAAITLKEVYDLLTNNNYAVFRIIPQGLVEITQWSPTLENYRYSNYLALYQGK
ncbi:MAG: FkbM family methyltransferase [Candidatus Dependentiae bacterium]|nr:FkbM family methyltransferase [Candidatus Dependentiae bacterium]